MTWLSAYIISITIRVQSACHDHVLSCICNKTRGYVSTIFNRAPHYNPVFVSSNQLSVESVLSRTSKLKHCQVQSYKSMRDFPGNLTWIAVRRNVGSHVPNVTRNHWT